MTHFWQEKTLEQLTHAEWESLCDGCAKCCLQKLEDEETGDIYFTNVHCRLLNTENGQCTDYPNRSTLVPDCVAITTEVLANPYWLPSTCAYRRLAEGKSLPDWHPLITTDADSTRAAGHCICGRTVCEDEAGQLDHHLISWVM